MQRMFRVMLVILGMVLWLPALADEVWASLRQGGVLILMRHTVTEPGLGDPPGFRLDDCRTQRNLSAQGRDQARHLGARLEARGIRPVAVFSSAWCRCIDTARLAFPGLPVRNLPALNSFFQDVQHETAQTNTLRQEMERITKAGVTVWVTHQVNVTALTGETIGMGDAVVLRPEGPDKFRLIGRLNL